MLRSASQRTMSQKIKFPVPTQLNVGYIGFYRKLAGSFGYSLFSESIYKRFFFGRTPLWSNITNKLISLVFYMRFGFKDISSLLLASTLRKQNLLYFSYDSLSFQIWYHIMDEF